MRIFILDDMEERHRAFRRTLMNHMLTHAYSFEEGCKLVSDSEKFDVFFLDHDLMDAHYTAYNGGYMSPQPFEYTGYHFVRWMIDDMPVEKRPELVVVHSWNDSGAARMARDLEEAGFKVHVEEFHVNLGANLKDNR